MATSFSDYSSKKSLQSLFRIHKTSICTPITLLKEYVNKYFIFNTLNLGYFYSIRDLPVFNMMFCRPEIMHQAPYVLTNKKASGWFRGWLIENTIFSIAQLAYFFSK